METTPETSRGGLPPPFPPQPSGEQQMKLRVQNKMESSEISSIQIWFRQKFHMINQSLGYNKIYIYQKPPFYAYVVMLQKNTYF